MVQAESSGQEIEIGGCVVQHAGEHAAAPEILLRGGDAQSAGVFFKEIKRRHHGGKNANE